MVGVKASIHPQCLSCNGRIFVHGGLLLLPGGPGLGRMPRAIIRASVYFYVRALPTCNWRMRLSLERPRAVTHVAAGRCGLGYAVHEVCNSGFAE